MVQHTIPFDLIFLAGGIGTRMGTEIPKQFLPLNDKPVALYSFDTFYKIPEIEEIVVVCDEEYRHFFADYDQSRLTYALPGLRRQDSVYNGLNALKHQHDRSLICVHDSARPLINQEDIRKVVRTAYEWESAVLGVHVKSTIKLCDASQFVINTLDRSHLWEIQTPQVVIYKLLKEGMEQAKVLHLPVTDDVSLVEFLGKAVKVVEGSYQNIKITTPEDLALAKILLQTYAKLQNDNSL